MKRILLFSLSLFFLLSSCVSKKKFTDLQTRQKHTQDLLNTATVKLNTCLTNDAAVSARAKALESQLVDMRKTNQDLIQTQGQLTTLTSKGADNLEKSLESLKEKDLTISHLRDALTKKDSVTLAIVTSFKKEIGINDPDIQINVEKGVVFISIANKLLFTSGSYNVTSKAKNVLAKVAKVVNGKPNFECLVEGYTDSVPYKKGVLIDNWDLSVKRATSVVRILISLDVKPNRLIAAGRGEYDQLTTNNNAEDRAKNRRTRILVLPKIDQFYDMVEKEMKNLSSKGN